MKCSSRVIMGAAIAMVIILGFVLALVLILLAELYCSLLLRRRKLKATKPGSNPENPSITQAQQTQDHHQSLPSPLSTIYAQGVLDAPRSFLFPKLSSKRKEVRRSAENDDVEKQKHRKLHQFLRIHSPNQTGLARSSLSSPSPTYIPISKPPQPIHNDPKPETEVKPEVGLCGNEASCHGGGGGGKREVNLMYISNPVYDNDVTRMSRGDTPFETPESSPTRLDRCGSSGEEEREKRAASSSPPSLPLTPMKELPAKACSVELKDARSCLGASGSESNNSHIGRSSSSSGSPCTSRSW